MSVYTDSTESTLTTVSNADDALALWLAGDDDAAAVYGDTNDAADDADADANENGVAIITAARRPIDAAAADRLAARRNARRIAKEDAADAAADAIA